MPLERFEYFTVSTQERVSLLRAVHLDRRPPCGRLDLPVPDGAPLRHHERPVEARFGKPLMQAEQAAVHLEADEIQARRPGHDLGIDVGLETRGRRRRRMVGVQLPDHLGNVVDGVVDPGVGVIVIELIADDPEQDGRMIAVLHDLATNEFELGRHGFGVVIVKPVPLVPQRQPERDRDAVRMRCVEQRARVLLLLRCIPGPNRISAGRRKTLDVVHHHASAFHPVGLAATQQLVATLGLHDFDGDRLGCVVAIVGAGSHEAQDTDNK